VVRGSFVLPRGQRCDPPEARCAAGSAHSTRAAPSATRSSGRCTCRVTSVCMRGQPRRRLQADPAIHSLPEGTPLSPEAGGVFLCVWGEPFEINKACAALAFVWNTGVWDTMHAREIGSYVVSGGRKTHQPRTVGPQGQLVGLLTPALARFRASCGLSIPTNVAVRCTGARARGVHLQVHRRT
jgi:hypothetical protein